MNDEARILAWLEFCVERFHHDGCWIFTLKGIRLEDIPQIRSYEVDFRAACLQVMEWGRNR